MESEKKIRVEWTSENPPERIELLAAIEKEIEKFNDWICRECNSRLLEMEKSALRTYLYRRLKGDLDDKLGTSPTPG